MESNCVFILGFKDKESFSREVVEVGKKIY
jgi:hypothetical protein